MGKFTTIFSVFILILAFNNCSNAEFDQEPTNLFANGFEIPEDEIDDIPDIDDEECKVGTVCLVIRDNFERTQILGSDFAWSTFLDDLGRNLGGLDVSIRDDAPASYGQSAVYFTGRTGGSVHSLYLISKSFDLTGFTNVTVEYDFLAASFESYNYQGDSGFEHFKVDLCTLTPAECGLTSNQSQSASRLKDPNRWKNLIQTFGNPALNQHLNGKNHTANSYTRVRGNTININLNAPGIDKSKVMLRWNVKLDEGFQSPTSPDAGILDNIVVRAYR